MKVFVTKINKNKIALQEVSINLENVDPVSLFGVQNEVLKEIKSFFPQLKIVSRGNELKLIGEQVSILYFQEKFDIMLQYFERFRKLSKVDIEKIMLSDESELVLQHPDDVILFGNGGTPIKPRNPKQIEFVNTIANNDMIFAVGPAGTGKTFLAVALAVRALKRKEVKRIILTRPAVEAGENLGFLPGDLKDKLDPYLQPLYDALRSMIPKEKLEYFVENNIIEVAPLAYMRGRTLDKAFVILDEAQNATITQLKMFMTRMGKHAKFIINGDPKQTDLPSKQKSGLLKSMEILRDIEGIDFIEFDENDIVRHPLVKKIINRFDYN